LNWNEIITNPWFIGGASGVVGFAAGCAASWAITKFGDWRPAFHSSGDCVELYVGNLSYDMTEAQMRKEFERFGTVKSSRIITHRFNHRSKGFGFIEMPNRAEAEAAIKATNGHDFLGRKLRVNEAKNKSHE